MSDTKLDDLDFYEIKTIYDKFSKKSLEFGEEDLIGAKNKNVWAALQIIAEDQYRTIGGGCVIAYNFKPDVKGESKKEFWFIPLDHAYRELDRDSKHELIGLFYWGNKLTLSPHYFSGRDDVHSLAYQQYVKSIERDQLNIDSLIREYENTHPLLHLTTLKEDIISYKNKPSKDKSKAEQCLADERKRLRGERKRHERHVYLLTAGFIIGLVILAVLF